MELRVLFALFFITCAVCHVPEHREHGHYDKDGKHSDEHDHKVFLGDKQQKEFSELTPEESLIRLGKMVDKIDKNSDGNITAEELRDWIQYISVKAPSDKAKKDYVKTFAYVLTDDGLVSWQEYLDTHFPGIHQTMESEQKRIGDQRKKFDAADVNKDEKLSEEEYIAFINPHLFEHMYDNVVAGIMEELDVDKDGKFSLQDRLAATPGQNEENVKADFEYRDQNKNGFLEPDEIREWYFPTKYDINFSEAKHLIKRADDDKNTILTKEEILKNINVFVGSKATQWGKSLKRSIDEL